MKSNQSNGQPAPSSEKALPEWREGRAIVFAGPVQCGKSRLQRRLLEGLANPQGKEAA